MHYVWKEWKENIRGKGLWLSFSIVILVSAMILYKSSILSFDQGFYILLLNLFDSMIYFIPILCLFLGAFSVFQEKEQKTLIMLLTRRESYFSFLLKKSLAVQTVLIGPIFIWFLIYLLPVKIYFQLDGKNYAIFLTSLLSLMLIFNQLGILIGSISRSRMQIIGYAVLLWFYFFFLHDFFLLALLPDVTYENVKLFSVAYFFNPLQSARIFLETGLQVYSFGHMSKLLQSFMWIKPSFLLIGNAGLLLFVSFILAVIFHRKEGLD
ncbi:ABC transporter permease [Bacillus sp. J33]|uniref:ABC transporter permease n=1 Tax=Bacillus sp. J33 TaxID=935836 RepID=UPI00047E2018|nr:ABC transporter permease subunit [Bacillus sp. J33]